MNTFVWIIQGLLACVFLARGLLFLFPPPAVRKIKKQLPFPVGFLQFICVAEVLAALGLTLPGWTGTLPPLTPLAAAGLAVIMGSAVVFHLSRREIPPALVTATLLGLAIFVACTRWFVISLAARVMSTHEKGAIMSKAGERVTLVTGGTDGIGRAVASQLARGGDRVLFVGRSGQRGAQVLAELRKAQPGVEHVFLPADLSLLAETARLADEVERHTGRLDAAVFCAGILSTVPEWTAEGLERNFVLNYLSRYLLARRLLPMLTQAPSGRLVLVANAGKYGDTLDFDDLQHRRGKPGLRVTGRTQFANDLLAVELADRLRDTRVEVTCVFPGVTDTGVFRNARGLPRVVRALAPVMVRLIGSSPEVAAETPVFLAQDARARDTGGRFYGPRLKQLKVPPRALRPERRSELWTASEDLVRPYLPDQLEGDHTAEPEGRRSNCTG